MPTLIVMPGTGSDDDFAGRAFGPAAARRGWRIVTPRPAADLVGGYVRALDDAAAASGDGVIVGGVSIGAVVALTWALHSPAAAACRGVVAALPPWSGEPGASLAAASARATADAIEADGLEPVIDAMTASSPAWLSAELSRSWRVLAPHGLLGQLRAAAAVTAPVPAELARLAVPLAVAGAPDDPLHPIDVAREWAAAAPRGALVEVPLPEWGPRPELLGHTALDCLDRLTPG